MSHGPFFQVVFIISAMATRAQRIPSLINLLCLSVVVSSDKSLFWASAPAEYIGATGYLAALAGLGSAFQRNHGDDHNDSNQTHADKRCKEQLEYYQPSHDSSGYLFLSFSSSFLLLSNQYEKLNPAVNAMNATAAACQKSVMINPPCRQNTLLEQRALHQVPCHRFGFHRSDLRNTLLSLYLATALMSV